MEQIMKRTPGTIDIQIGNMLLTIYDRGWDRKKHLVKYKDIQLGVHFHAMFEFQYVLDNHLQLKTQTDTYTAKCGEYILIPPNCYHYTNYADEGFERYSFVFSILALKSDADGFSEFDYYFRILGRVRNIVIHNNGVISDCIRRIVELEKEQKDIRAKIHKMRILFSMLFLAITEDIDPKQQADGGSCRKISPEKIKLQNEITNFIMDHYDISTVLRDLENEFHISSRHINRMFHELFGMPVSAMVLDIRMHSAWNYIVESDFALEKIAKLIGYNSYNTFYRAFRKYYGFSAEILRKQK